MASENDTTALLPARECARAGVGEGRLADEVDRNERNYRIYDLYERSFITN